MDPDFEIFDSSSSEEEEEEIILALDIEEERLGNERVSTSHRRSIPQRAFNRRNSLEGHERLFQDYFSKSPTYPPNLFRSRFRMQRHLFLHIQAEVEAYEPYFVQRRDAAKRLGQKITAAMRILAYGVSGDFVDEHLRIAENTAAKCLKKFVKAIIGIFSHEYLRSPNENDIARLCAVGDSRGFPGMLGSIDCMHWKWKNCPSAWKGISHNDINVLEHSSVFKELAEGHAPKVNYSINGNDYSMSYYLADGIYPSWLTFVKTIHAPHGCKNKHFAATQESARKDVERAFGVLQARFAIVRGPARFYDRKTLKEIMMACIILHNMIVEDERHTYLRVEDFVYEQSDEITEEPMSHEHTNEFVNFIQRHHHIRDRGIHFQLQSDLIEHL
ncbi:uncharacterized protein LOC133795823 [Humulus lupulus]|uniref:uncharacterized protein LOC133795823 n=1 Tax=Humulus lupulus TaxID=3486 RepID=UPI002B41740C|nr:uncharacterized protein LOC133795823 [Humulus lupulus]